MPCLWDSSGQCLPPGRPLQLTYNPITGPFSTTVPVQTIWRWLGEAGVTGTGGLRGGVVGGGGREKGEEEEEGGEGYTMSLNVKSIPALLPILFWNGTFK